MFAGEPLPASPGFREELDKVTDKLTSNRALCLVMLERLGTWRNTLAPEFTKHDFHEDFVCLALAESKLDNSAKSPGGAAGIWQIMEQTALRNGMIVNGEVDQRFDYTSSTKVASDLLVHGHNKFGNWLDALLAYNMGAGGYSKLLKANGANTISELNAKTGRLSYIYRILAIKRVLAEPKKYGYAVDVEPRVINTRIVEVTTGVKNLRKMAESYNMTKEELYKLNPWIKSNVNSLSDPNGKTYYFQVPTEKDLGTKSTIPGSLPIRKQEIKQISARFGMRMNPITEKKQLHSGIDLAAPLGTNVYATGAGTVVAAGYDDMKGHHVEILHPEGITSHYWHLKDVMVQKDGVVTQGQPVGHVGNSGKSLGAHLHYEIRSNGEPVNPEPYMNGVEELPE